MNACLSLSFMLLLCIKKSAVGWVSSHQMIGRRTVSITRNGSNLQMGLTSGLKRVRDSILSKERTRKDLKIGIAGFYDRSSKLWEDVWGEVCEMLKILSFDACFHCCYFILK